MPQPRQQHGLEPAQLSCSGPVRPSAPAAAGFTQEACCLSVPRPCMCLLPVKRPRGADAACPTAPAAPQIVFALIAFAAAASLYNGYEGYKVSFVQFMVFTGVMAFLISIFYAIVSCVEGLKRTFSGLIEVMVNTLWVIFWMAAAASFAAYQPCKIKDADLRMISKCDVFLASQAFAWLSWFLWIGSLWISIIEMRNGEGLTGGEALPSSAHAPLLTATHPGSPAWSGGW